MKGIIAIDGTSMDGSATFARVSRSLRAGLQIEVRYHRSGAAAETTVRLRPVARDSFDGVSFEYGSTVSRQGFGLRTVISRPVGSRGTLMERMEGAQ